MTANRPTHFVLTMRSCCRECAGHGIFDAINNNDVRPGMRYPTFHVTCARCNGSGYEEERVDLTTALAKIGITIPESEG